MFLEQTALLELFRHHVWRTLLAAFAVLIQRKSSFTSGLLLELFVIFVVLSDVVEVATNFTL